MDDFGNMIVTLDYLTVAHVWKVIYFFTGAQTGLPMVVAADNPY